MPKTKKSVATDNTIIKTNLPPEEDLSIVDPVTTERNTDIVTNEKIINKTTKDISSDTQEPVTEIPKQKFKRLHIEDNYWLENDIYQTMVDLTSGKKNAKAVIINQALKDYFEKNKITLTLFKAKGKKE